MKKKDAIKFLQQLYPNGGHCWLDEQRIEAIDMAIKALKEEPVSGDIQKVGSLKSLEYYPEKKTTNKTSKGVFDANMPRRKAYLRGFKDGAHAHKELIANKSVSEYIEEAAESYAKYERSDDGGGIDVTRLDAFIEGAQWQKQQDSISSKDLAELIDTLSKRYPEVSFAKLSRIAVRVAKWQKEHLWKPADGDDLPEYEREVVVFTQNFPNDAGMMSVSIAHRPNPDGFDGKSLTTGEVEHYTPKTYGKGGWNIPNIVYWLDIELPKEIEL